MTSLLSSSYFISYYQLNSLLIKLFDFLITTLTMDVKDYLKRIKFDSEIRVDLATLTKLQQCHQTNVPYETLDIFDETRIVLEV